MREESPGWAARAGWIISMAVVFTAAVLTASGAPAANGPSPTTGAASGVTVEIVEVGEFPDRKWPAALGPVAESYPEEAFGFFHEPWRYVSTGVRADRPSPHLFRARARIALPAGGYRVLVRTRNAARLHVGGALVAEVKFSKAKTDGHNPVRHDFLDLGPETRYMAPGDYEVLAVYQATGEEQEWVLETVVGGKAGKEILRNELGETVVAVAPTGTNDFRLLAPHRVVPLTDGGWDAYRAERAAHYDRVESTRRAEAGEKHAPYWRTRHLFARDYARRNPAPAPPILPASAKVPVWNAVDRFLGAKVIAASRSGAMASGSGFGAQVHREVLPLLTSKCGSCHGKAASGGLRLDSAAALLKGGASGKPSLRPGDPEGSLLLERVRSTDPHLRMPPGGQGLKPAEIEILSRWIKQGAPWPEAATPVRTGKVVAKGGTAPSLFSPLTDDLAFLRRVTLDLVGTVPTVAEIRAFAADRRPDRRSRAIDRLLTDRRWADPWVAYWQDLLGENPNLVNSTLNNTGPFRYWLYESFRDNKPLDLLVTELIRMEGSPYGGGPAGFGLAAMNDAPLVAKAGILGTAFLATEMKCARCHDAPYHASKQSDLFNLAAMLTRAPVAVPATSSVPADKLAGRKSLIRVTLKPGEKVPPHWSLASLAKAEYPDEWLQQPGDTREQLAALVTSPWNERFAEVMANRVWARYMGRGIVEPQHDWENAKPSHPELLRWLARELSSHNYDLKHLTRLILNSHAYQRQARQDSAANKLFAAPMRRRLSAEQLVDSTFDAFGQPLDVEPLCIDLDGARPPVNGLNFGQPRRAWEFVNSSNERDRPSLTLPRNEAITELLTAFGWSSNRQDANPDRRVEPMAIQPALLANGTASRWLTRLSDPSAVTRLCLESRSAEELVDLLFMRVLTRRPTPAERKEAVALVTPGFATRVRAGGATIRPKARKPRPYVSWSNHLNPEASAIRIQEAAAARQGPPPTERLRPEWRERAEDLLWSLLNAPELVYVP